MILAGRRINDGMGKYIAERAIKMLIRTGKKVQGANVTVLGITFKENVPDLRNTRVVDIIHELKEYGVNVRVHDPLADPVEAYELYNIRLKSLKDVQSADVVVLAVMHDFYVELGMEGILKICRNSNPVVLDIKGVFTSAQAKKSGIAYWRL
jgi:UDP-N-acetyl-D-galactosamine dehydrogenase